MQEFTGSRCWRSAAALAATFALAVMAPQAGAQVNSKWITVVVPAEPPGIDGCNANRSFEGRVIKQNVVETLIGRDAKDGALKPSLMTSWEQVDPKTWRFTLREGIKFHDGAPFNAETATKAIQRSLGPELKAAGQFCEVREKYFSDIKLEITPTGPYAMQIVTDRPEPILPTRLSNVAISSPNTPNNKHTLHPIGTGPYVFDSWTTGQEIRLKRFDGYWGAKPPVEGVRYIWREESAVRAAMAKVGEADIALNITPQDANDPSVDYSYLNSETSYLRIDLTRPPLTDKRVRLALNYAMDREGIRQSILSKDLQHATQMVMPSIAGHNHELDKMVRAYDPAKARQLIAEAKAAGVPVDKEILLIGRPASYFNAAEVMEAFLGMYQDIGLNVKLINLEPGQYNEVNNKPFAEDRGPTLLQSSHDNNTGDPIFSALKVSCNGPQSMVCDPTVESMIAKVATQTGEERVKGWQEVFRYLYEEIVPEVWMYHMVGYARVNKRINFVPDVTTNNEVRVQEITFN